jgi:hypothetical protein
MNPKTFFGELKRKVYKVAIAYRVIAWLLQIAFENYRARLNRSFDVENEDLYRAE